ncbi:hypothetical protein BKA81DRAFT_55514 [Phyllosticta paracitricarpa]
MDNVLSSGTCPVWALLELWQRDCFCSSAAARSSFCDQALRIFTAVDGKRRLLQECHAWQQRGNLVRQNKTNEGKRQLDSELTWQTLNMTNEIRIRVRKLGGGWQPWCLTTRLTPARVQTTTPPRLPWPPLSTNHPRLTTSSSAECTYYANAQSNRTPRARRSDSPRADFSLPPHRRPAVKQARNTCARVRRAHACI